MKFKKIERLRTFWRIPYLIYGPLTFMIYSYGIIVIVEIQQIFFKLLSFISIRGQVRWLGKVFAERPEALTSQIFYYYIEGFEVV
jgi:hypothetical protein